MRVLFAGTPEFAVAPLDAIIAAGHAIPLVLTQPDRPAGRGMAIAESPVKRAALNYGLEVAQPPTLKDPAIQQRLRDAQADVMVVVAYGLILPQAVLDIPRCGALNIHASLLPRWRGAAPIQRAIEAGEDETGVTIMRMDAGLDTGPMLIVGRTPIRDDDTAGSLHDRLQDMGARLIVEALQRLAAGTQVERPQPEDGATYAAKLERGEGAINWQRPAGELARRVRAFNPFPGCTAIYRDVSWKVWAAAALDDSSGVHDDVTPGTVVRVGDDGIDVRTGEGVLRLLVVQKAGGRRVAVCDLLRGTHVRAGDRFTTGISTSSP